MLNLNSLFIATVLRGGGGGSPYDPDAQAFIDAAGITDEAIQQKINTLVLDLKGDNLWSGLKVLYPFAGTSAASHKYNLKDPRDLDAAFRLTFSGGWTHNEGEAYGNGTDGYANTHFDPSDLTDKLQVFYGLYVSQYNTAAGDTWGGVTSGQLPRYRTALWGSAGATNTFWETGSGAAQFISNFGYGVDTGLFSFNMDAGAFTLGTNNYAFSTGTDSFTPTSGPFQDWYLSAFNNNGSVSGYSNFHYNSVVIYDQSLTVIERAKLQSALDNYFGGRANLNAPNNLWTYYKFDTGAFTTDSSGQGFTLTNVGSVAEVAGKYGTAAEFDGTNYLYGSTDAGQEPFNGATTWNACAWISLDNYTSDQAFLHKQASTFVGFRVIIRPGVPRDILVTAGSTNMGFALPSGAFTDTTWHHVTVRLSSGNQFRVYLDGEQLGNLTRTTTYTNAGSTALHIGRSSLSAAGFLYGRIDDLAIYRNTRLLDRGEIYNMVYSDYAIKS